MIIFIHKSPHLHPNSKHHKIVKYIVFFTVLIIPNIIMVYLVILDNIDANVDNIIQLSMRSISNCIEYH